MALSVVIVGGGIVGSACALFLARSGLKVTVLEREYPGGGATSEGMGHLVTIDDSVAQLDLTLFSQQLWRENEKILSDQCEVRKCGTLWIAENDVELDVAREKCEQFRVRGAAAEIVNATQLKQLEPALRPSMAGALRVTGDSVIYPPGAVRDLLRASEALGAVVHRRWNVEGVDEGSVFGTGGKVSADHIVIAAGVETSSLCPELPIFPRRGHLAITERYPLLLRHQLVELGYVKRAHEMSRRSVAFNVQPRSTGQILVGSSREIGETSRTPDLTVVAEMLARAEHFLPAISSCVASRVWTGFRPATADGLPLIGKRGGSSQLWIAAGHEGLGITTSMGTAALLADMIVGRQTVIDPSPFNPNRATNLAQH